jgi:hypothetical protein
VADYGDSFFRCASWKKVVWNMQVLNSASQIIELKQNATHFCVRHNEGLPAMGKLASAPCDARLDKGFHGPHELVKPIPCGIVRPVCLQQDTQSSD